MLTFEPSCWPVSRVYSRSSHCCTHRMVRNHRIINNLCLIRCGFNRITRRDFVLFSLDPVRLCASFATGVRVRFFTPSIPSISSATPFRFPKSLVYVILDGCEKAYLAGFPLLLVFVNALPMIVGRKGCPSNDPSCPKESGADGFQQARMEFLPLMLTSVYCAIGLIWGFIRLVFIYLYEETTYRGQLSNLG